MRKLEKPTTAFSRIDFGSAWYARCASESPSIARSSLLLVAIELRVEGVDLLHQALGRNARRLAAREPHEIVDGHGRTVEHAQLRQAGEAVGARKRRRH